MTSIYLLSAPKYLTAGSTKKKKKSMTAKKNQSERLIPATLNTSFLLIFTHCLVFLVFSKLSTSPNFV